MAKVAAMIRTRVVLVLKAVAAFLCAYVLYTMGDWYAKPVVTDWANAMPEIVSHAFVYALPEICVFLFAGWLVAYWVRGGLVVEALIILLLFIVYWGGRRIIFSPDDGFREYAFAYFPSMAVVVSYAAGVAIARRLRSPNVRGVGGTTRHAALGEQGATATGPRIPDSSAALPWVRFLAICIATAVLETLILLPVDLWAMTKLGGVPIFAAPFWLASPHLIVFVFVLYWLRRGQSFDMRQAALYCALVAFYVIASRWSATTLLPMAFAVALFIAPAVGLLFGALLGWLLAAPSKVSAPHKL